MTDNEERKVPAEGSATAPDAARERGSDAFTCILSGKALDAGLSCRDAAGNLVCATCPVALEFFAEVNRPDRSRVERRGSMPRERRGTR